MRTEAWLLKLKRDIEKAYKVSIHEVKEIKSTCITDRTIRKTEIVLYGKATEATNLSTFVHITGHDYATYEKKYSMFGTDIRIVIDRDSFTAELRRELIYGRS